MSIEFLTFDTGRSSLARSMAVSAMTSAAGRKKTGPDAHAAGRTSQRRIEANRRNSKRSTGPRSAAGKRRSSRNALKHGLCAVYAHLPSECDASHRLFVQELRDELQPRTVMQRTLFPQIADLIWRLDRMPESQAKIFDEELRKAARTTGEKLSASEVLARRFSDDPACNGFLLMGRYERGLRNQLLQLMRRYQQLAREGDADGRDRAPSPPRAWTPEKAEAQHRYFESSAGKLELERINASVLATQAEQTQSKPIENCSNDVKTGKCAPTSDPPPTEQTHRDAPAPHRLAPSRSP
ncbi:MAG: hypothetical protein ABIP55_04280 [Tepidisphaeraceae bacterium]